MWRLVSWLDDPPLLGPHVAKLFVMIDVVSQNGAGFTDLELRSGVRLYLLNVYDSHSPQCPPDLDRVSLGEGGSQFKMVSHMMG